MKTIDKIKIFLIYSGAFLTYLIYSFIGYNRISILKVNESLDSVQIVLIILGSISCLIGYFLNYKIHNLISFYNSRIIKMILNTNTGSNSIFSTYIIFFILSMAFYQTSAMYTLIGFFLSTNLLYVIILGSITITFHILGFPKIKKIEYLIQELNKKNGV